MKLIVECKEKHVHITIAQNDTILNEEKVNGPTCEERWFEISLDNEYSFVQIIEPPKENPSFYV